jgi:nanoRNase/pAp phosphatase (c-di-AMP/oligoRNAs hydrolase)
MREQVVISMGRSIFAPAEEQKVDVGALMRTYGGGGHPGAGKCSVKSDDFERILGEIVDEVTSLNSAKDC